MRIEGKFQIDTDVEEKIVLHAFKQFMIENFQQFKMDIKAEKIGLKHEEVKGKIEVEEKEKVPGETQGVIG